MATRASRLPAWSTRRRLRHGDRHSRRAAPANGRSRWSPSCRLRRVSGAGDRPTGVGAALHRGRQDPGRGLQVESGADHQDAEGTARPDRVEQLRRGVSREDRALRQGGHQPAREGATAESRHPVRRDAGGRRLRADGRRHSPVDTGRARSLRGGRTCRVDPGCGGCIAWREVRQPLRSTELPRRRRPSSAAAAIPRRHLVFDAGAHSRAQEQWTGRRLRRRRPERGWSQRSAPRRESPRRQRRAGLRTARCAGPGADSSTGAAVLAGRIVRRCGPTAAGSGAGCERHPGRHRIRILRRIRPGHGVESSR